MKDSALIAGALVGLMALAVIGVWWEVGLWNECRIDHSWFYCIRVLRH